jgi:hypothetical protein
MDGFADAMIARGPTLASDGETATGSLHVLGLPSVAAAAEFVEQEPNNRAGVYAEHGLWVFENLLGRTMWDFAGDAHEQTEGTADTRQTHQKRHARRLATHLWGLARPDLQGKLCRE